MTADHLIPITVLLADPDQLVGAGLRATLSRDERFTIVGEVTSGIVPAVQELQPDVIVVDPLTDSSIDTEMLAALQRAAPASRIIVCTRLRSRDGFQSAVHAGVYGYVVSGPHLDLDRLRRTVEAVGLDGSRVFDPVVSGYLGEFAAGAPPVPEADERSASLTPRELQILALVGQDLSDQAIALRLGISDNTIRSHIRALRAKLGIETRSGLGAFAMEHGLTRPE